jgi:hypothetical protein
VSEFGLSAAVGPLNVGVLAAGGADDGAWLMRDNGTMAQLVEQEVRCGAVRCGAVRCGAVRCGAVRCGVVWCGVVWCGVVWCGVVW